MKILAITIAFACLTIAAERGELIKLWPNGAPGADPSAGPEVSKPSVSPKYAGLPGNYTVAHEPAIYVFLPPKDKATGAAMVVAPGGGHRQLVMEKEGWEVADWLNDRGIAAFVLKYRLAKAEGAKYTLPDQVFADAARSIRLVRIRAKEWSVDPARIGFIGFSAGGEVAGMIGTKFDAGQPDATDPVERASSRPDFNVLVYPWYRPGAMRADAPPLFSIPADAPQTFMMCSTEDRSHVEPTVKYYMELEAKKIPVEMHIYNAGPHGVGLRRPEKALPIHSWTDRLVEWLADSKISPR